MNKKDVEKIRTTIRLNSNLNSELIKRSKELGVSKNAYVNMILSEKVNKIEV